VNSAAKIPLVVAALARAELPGVTTPALAVALKRAEEDGLTLDQLLEREIAIALLQRTGYPEDAGEFTTFLQAGQVLSRYALSADEIAAPRALQYVRWVAAFLDDPEPGLRLNARLFLRWLVAHFGPAISADPTALDNLRRVADDSATSARSSAYIVYALGVCGGIDDYDRVTRHAEQVIEHDREHIDLVAEGLYKLYPPALINALEYFLDHTQISARQKQLNTGLHLLSKVAEIEDREFWTTYYDAMTGLVDRLSELGTRSRSVERLLDQIEKHIARAAIEEGE
jgi:hypothetical protein